ncbi:MAG: 2,3-bisphosphoglycerate-independent phosphoglycerate mutase [Phycisphaerales bacterium]|nr:2,3-bisphosphoglycerate-independent phosphoglycerate mutase [Phycisphaerales bacterium]MCB9864198.1 2,3-bisphosphoglycerate-independent phosphoglycerate mutase [Phycisphaerales bacterium]
MKLERRPLLLIVRDGWGHNPYPEWDKANAVKLAKTPVADRLLATYPWVQIKTSGEDVGLPAGVMGNSEVGHQNIGAGRIVDQEVMRITRRIRDGSFFENPRLVGAFEHAKKTGGAVHLLGLCSDGRVHSDLDHLLALIDMSAKWTGVPVFIHAIMDGRDTPPTKGADYLATIDGKCRSKSHTEIASVIGRFYAMDRDNRWDRVQKAYDLLVAGRSTEDTVQAFDSAAAAISDFYLNPTTPQMAGDEFVTPSRTCADEQSRVKDGDAVIFFNYRGDRPRELVKAFVYDEFPYRDGDKMQGFDRGKKLENLYFCTMANYEKGLPVHVVFDRPAKMENILGAYASSLGLKQFRCAETEKFPHVTFFFNDYREEPFDGEDRQIVPSPRDVTTYDQKPEMSAHGVTEEMLRRIDSDKYDLFILNYANGDMVGHTGKLDAAIKAVETVDACVGKVVDAVLAKGGAAIVTADHGNCEQMIDPQTGGPHTAHTTYDVDLIVVDDRLKGRKLREGGRLADIAPTLLALGGINKPAEMTGESLVIG